MIKTSTFGKLVGTSLGKYYIERHVGQSKIGPTFLVRSDTTTNYLLRFMHIPMNTLPRERAVYLEHFQFRAKQIAALQHPYLLPLLDYGVFHGLPYLVSPHLPLRSLRSRLAKNGTLDFFTVGRYLDQVATALEYAHEHSVLHGSLSVDSIFIRLDGNLVVADTGVRSILEMNPQAMVGNQLLEQSEGYAPEQLLRKPSSPATDVYALGEVVYQLLTGRAAFEGSTVDERIQQHLYAFVPLLTQWRSDLPVGLSTVLTRALAKEPAQRYAQPGAFANAYHSAMGETNRTRLPFVVSSVPAGQGPASSPGVPPADMQYPEHNWSNNGRATTVEHIPITPPLEPPSSAKPSSLYGISDDESLNFISNPRPDLLRRLGQKPQRRSLLIAVVLLLLLLGSSVLGITLLTQKGGAMSGRRGQVTFFANQNDPAGETNSLNITIQNLQAPPAGSNYEAWIINDSSEAVLSLGKLTGKGSTWSLTYSNSSSNLLEVGDKLEITQEQGTVTAPVGQVVLTGSFPVLAFQHIQHLLVSFPETPDKIGMLMGLLQQTHLLDSQATILQSVATSRNTVAVGCIAQSMIDIIEGKAGAHYQPLPAACAGQNVTATGDGYGLLNKGFVANSEEHAALALSQKDATSGMRQHAALMDIALTNVSGWVTTIEQHLLQVRANPTDLSSLQEIAILADDAYHGVDTNGDGQVDPVAGEAGAITAYQQGQFMATVILVPSA